MFLSKHYEFDDLGAIVVFAIIAFFLYAIRKILIKLSIIAIIIFIIIKVIES